MLFLLEKRYDPKQHAGADDGSQKDAPERAPESGFDADPVQQVAADEAADDADDEVSRNPDPEPLTIFPARKPARAPMMILTRMEVRFITV